ncbi:MAG TPA: response regulator transcription factor [Thermoanaerobaculia bacterium]|nr:response regulator transcription factor [Thermoanaerobaculia bacterium]
MPIRLILADDHPIILDGLQQLFRLEPDFEVVACCRDGEETLKALRLHAPDILVLDIRMPRGDGLAVLRALAGEKLAEEKPATRVVLLTAAVEENQLVEALELGVGGVVLKEMAPRLLVEAVREVHGGGRWLDQGSTHRALDKLLQREANSRETARLLTPRELEIVRMVARGLRNRAIAEQLFITEGTVKIHLHNIYQKVEVDGRLELTLYAQSRGLV